MHPARLSNTSTQFPGAGPALSVPDADRAARPERPRFIRHPVEIPLRCRRLVRRATDLVDLEYGGLHFIRREPFAPATKLVLLVAVLGEEHRFCAQVLWCRELGERHEITVGFSAREDAFRARMIEQFCQIECYRRRMRVMQGRDLSPDAAAREWVERFAAHFP